jgi:hypothetical protein
MNKGTKEWRRDWRIDGTTNKVIISQEITLVTQHNIDVIALPPL